MDSTDTLVNPVPSTPYYFSADSMKNTTIFAQRSRPLYSVSTDIKSNKQTKVSEAQTGRLIAVVNRRDFFPDTISFPDKNGGQAVNLHRWLEKSTLPDGYQVHLMQTSAGLYMWKSNATHRWALYQRDDPTLCIAYLQPSSATQNFALVLESVAEPFRDEIVVAFLILEQGLRIADKDIYVSLGKFDANKTMLGRSVRA